jgi:hypothetical protein
MRELGGKGHEIIVPTETGAGNGKRVPVQAEPQGINPVWRGRRSLAKLASLKSTGHPAAIEDWQGRLL